MRSLIALALILSLPVLAAADAGTAAPAGGGAELGLDLSPESAVKPVVLVPPIYKVTSSEGGSFAGFASAKVTEKLDLAAHRKLVQAFEKHLGGGKVISTDATNAAIAKDKLKIDALRTTNGMAQLAKVTNTAWVVFFDINKGALTGSVYNLLGEPQAKTATISGVAVSSLTVAQADEIARSLAKGLVELSAPKKEEAVVAPVAVVTPPPAEEEVTGDIEKELARERERRRSVIETIDLNSPRVEVTVGAGGAFRDQRVGGDYAGSLASVRNKVTLGVSAFVQVNPLNFFRAFKDKPYNDLFIDFTYRRDFVRATGSGAGLEGQSCSVTDDALAVRGNFRWKLGGMLPSIGVGAGWAQERAAYTCNLPVVSAIYRGVDVQLRVRQPLFKDLIALDVSFGPRILMPGPFASKTGLSWAGEAWIEAKPISVLFIRGGARYFRAVMSDDVGIVTVDARGYVALEAGVHF